MRKTVFTLTSVLLFGFSLTVRAATTSLIWHGHAAFEIVTPKGRVLLIDPWLTNPKNPNAGDKKDPLSAVKKLDYILVTHGHPDHVGNAVDLAKRTGARLVSNSELGSNMVKVLGYPQAQMGYDTLMNIGGEITIADGEVKVSLTPAVHSSGMKNPNAGPKHLTMVYGGNPTGIVLKIVNGPTIYHTGDTAYFQDMALIKEQYSPDVALINIGGHFGMEPPMAAKAATTVGAKLVIPHHYGTFPILTQDPGPFVENLKKRGIVSRIMRPGEKISFEGRRLQE